MLLKKILTIVLFVSSQVFAQNVVTNPTSSQPIVQPVGTNTSVNNFAGFRYVVPSYNWTQSPSGSLTAGVQATVTLTPCPLGVDTTSGWYYVYIATTGTAEATLVTSGTCTSGAGSGTITFTPANTHTAGYTVGSASTGLQEAINDSGTPHTVVIIPPKTNPNIYGRVSVRQSDVRIVAYGNDLVCNTRDVCAFLGDPGNSNTFTNVRWVGGRFQPGLNITSAIAITNTAVTGCPASCVATITTNGTHPFVVGDWVNIWFTTNTIYMGIYKVASVPTASTFTITSPQFSSNIGSAASVGVAALEVASIEDNALGSSIDDVSWRSGAIGNERFNLGVVVDNDQSFYSRNLDTRGSGAVMHCDATYCGVFVYTPGPSSIGVGQGGGAATGVFENPNISPQCGGNGFIWWAGNNLSIRGGNIQGTNQFGILTGNQRGGFPETLIDNVHFENGSCSNIKNATLGNAGIILNGSTVKISRTTFGGSFPRYTCSAGTNLYQYYVVAVDGSGNKSVPLPAGYASSCATPPGTIIVWNQIRGANTYDILRTANSAFPAQGPFGTGNFAVATAQTQSVCTNGACTLTDNSATPSSYTVTLQQGSNFFPALDGWPGAVVLAGSNNNNQLATVARYFGDKVALPVPDVATTDHPNIFLSGEYSLAESYPYAGNIAQIGPIVSAARFGAGSIKQEGAFVLHGAEEAGPVPGNIKGKGNMSQWAPGFAPLDLWTLWDSNEAKTSTFDTNRPSADANDMAMGSDQSVSSLPGYALRSSTSISEYIGHVFDNTNWLTRLTSSGLTLKTPLSTNFQITSTLPTDCTVLDRVDNSGQQLDRLQSPEAAELRYYNQLFGYRDFKWAGRLRQGYVGGWNSNSDRHQSRIFQQH